MIKDLIHTDYAPACQGQFLVYEIEDRRVKIDVRLSNETTGLIFLGNQVEQRTASEKYLFRR